MVTCYKYLLLHTNILIMFNTIKSDWNNAWVNYFPNKKSCAILTDSHFSFGSPTTQITEDPHEIILIKNEIADLNETGLSENKTVDCEKIFCNITSKMAADLYIKLNRLADLVTSNRVCIIFPHTPVFVLMKILVFFKQIESSNVYHKMYHILCSNIQHFRYEATSSVYYHDECKFPSSISQSFWIKSYKTL